MTSHWFYQGYTFEFIKAVSDTVLDMINAVHHDKPWIFNGATVREKLNSHHQTVSRNKLYNPVQVSIYI